MVLIKDINYINIMIKHIVVDEDLHGDLTVLKGIFEFKNMTQTIRKIMKFAGYSEPFFEKMEELLNRREDGTD